MKNKDLIAMEKAKIVEKMNQAIADNDAKAFNEAFAELCQKIEENVLEEAKEMLLVEDVEDRDFLGKLFEAMYEELPEPKKKK